MIDKQFLFPEYYIAKIPKCDDCKVKLQDTGISLMTNPPQRQFVCPKCSKQYNIYENELQGEWRWRTI